MLRHGSEQLQQVGGSQPPAPPAGCVGGEGGRVLLLPPALELRGCPLPLQDLDEESGPGESERRGGRGGWAIVEVLECGALGRT